jgi:hypothetical protein
LEELGDDLDATEAGNSARQDASGQPDSGEDAAAKLRKAALSTAGAGVAFVVLFLASVFTLSQTPGARASDAAIAEFYAGDGRRSLVLAGLYLLPLAAVAFLWFVAILRDWESGSARRLSRVLSNVQLLSGIGFITLALASAAASTVAAFAAEFGGGPVDPSVARQFPLYGSALLYVFAMRMAAIFVTSTAGLVRATGLFPRWFVLVSYLVAVFLFLAASVNVALVLVFPAWILLFSGMIAAGTKSISPETGSPTASGDALGI